MGVNRNDRILSMLQKPIEIFSGIMPINRQLYSKRLCLRRFKKIDALETKQLMSKNRSFLTKWLQPQPELLRIEHILALIKDDHKQAKAGSRLDLGIFDSISERLIGKIALHSVDYGIQRSAYVSYWLDEEEQSKGYMTEALATIISFAFEEASLHRINLKIGEGNKASSKLAKKLGFKKEGTERKSLFIDGKWLDADIYGLLDEEYDKLADDWIEKGYLGN